MNNVERLPLINVSDLFLDNQEDHQRIADEIGCAARDTGFFRISGHGISPETIEDTYQAAKRFFDKPDTYKRKYYIGDNPNHRGYVPFTEKGNYADEMNRSYEAFDLGQDLPENDPDFLSGVRVLGPNIWPELPDFYEPVSLYYEQISALGRKIVSCLELHLGLAKGSMTRKMTKPISQLRLLHYVRQQETKNHKSVNMGAHTDYECLTLLHTRNVGLQVMTKEDKWIDVPVDPNVFVVNIGDMLEAWTNGLFKSTPHRVLNTSPERFSLPYFVAANYDTVVEPFPELVTRERPSAYKPFVAGEHLERMLVRDFPYLQDIELARSAATSLAQSVGKNPFEVRLNGYDT